VNTSRATPTVEAVEDMRCVVEVLVQNGSSRPVRLDDAHAAYMGPNAMTVVRAAPSPLLDGSANYGHDARYALNRTVPAGGEHAFEMTLEFRPSGCGEGTATIYDWPTVDLTVLGRSHQVAADKNFRYHRTGKTPGCAH